MIKLKFFLFLALLGVAIASPLLRSTESKLNPRIVGGQIAKEGQFPYQISLQNPETGHFCGGSILNEKWIITAAHCERGIGQDTVVVVGTTDFLKPGNTSVKHNIEKIIRHNKYNVGRRNANDLTLIKIKETIKFNHNVQPVKLPETNLNRKNVPVVASGWGRLSVGGIRPTQLQYLPSFVYDNDSCVKLMATIPNFPALNDDQICTFTEWGQGLCHGDSGGPVVSADFLIGVISLAYPCAQGYPDVHTNVWKYLDWINATIKQN